MLIYPEPMVSDIVMSSPDRPDSMSGRRWIVVRVLMLALWLGLSLFLAKYFGLQIYIVIGFTAVYGIYLFTKDIEAAWRRLRKPKEDWEL
jgi:uncharacterized membrane protein YuzA (DUF378 family)